MNDRISSAIKRIQHYQFENGTYELQTGLCFFLAGVFLLPLPMSSSTQGMIQGAGIAGFILALLLGEYFRRRFVYPPSGYVNGIPGTAKKRISRFWPVFLLSIATAIMIVSPILLIDGGPAGDAGAAWVILTTGLFLSVLTAFLGLQSRVPRLLVVAIIMAGLAILFSPAIFGTRPYIYSSYQTPYWVIYASQLFSAGYFLSIGVVFSISGGIGFLNYLHANPLPVEVVDEQ